LTGVPQRKRAYLDLASPTTSVYFGRRSEHVIRAQALQKRFGDLEAVAGISFEIVQGEIFGLLGPNGAGKTTTINMLIGALQPDGGSVRIDGGGDPTDPAVRRKIGNAPQALALYDELTGEENLQFFGRLYGLSGGALKQRIEQMLELVGLADRRHDRVGKYSGGMKRRLNLACALVHDPALLLLDEPTVGVDPQSRNLIFDRIESLKREGRTVVYTTHYMEEAERLCDRIAIIDHGRILALDHLEGLLREHGGHSVVTAVLDGALPDSAQLPGTLNEGELRFESDQPLKEVARLSSRGLNFRTLHIDRPDLEGVFLNLTGRSLRD
jgi:ABC-2 type transport system ATP-binding protein